MPCELENLKFTNPDQRFLQFQLQRLTGDPLLSLEEHNDTGNAAFSQPFRSTPPSS